MNRWKSSFTCSFCSKIFKDPIELPCKHILCKEHLCDREIQKENKIKCVDCKQDFQVNGSDFKSIECLTKFLTNRLYLSDEELNLKQKIEESMRVFYEMYTKIDTDVHGHFQEMVRLIDEHRVKLKQRIDEYALAMIDKVKKCEISYLKNLSVTQEASMRRVEETNLVEESLRGVEELFRDPNLLIESIREMQRKQEKAVADIKVKLNEMSYVREHLKASNEFRANFSFSQELFGSLYLNDNTSNDLFKSKIFSNLPKCL
jgi:hypothetical protein